MTTIKEVVDNRAKYGLDRVTVTVCKNPGTILNWKVEVEPAVDADLVEVARDLVPNGLTEDRTLADSVLATATFSEDGSFGSAGFNESGQRRIRLALASALDEQVEAVTSLTNLETAIKAMAGQLADIFLMEGMGPDIALKIVCPCCMAATIDELSNVNAVPGTAEKPLPFIGALCYLPAAFRSDAEEAVKTTFVTALRTAMEEELPKLEEDLVRRAANIARCRELLFPGSSDCSRRTSGRKL